MDSQGLSSYFRFSDVNWPNMWEATWETIWMTVVSVAIVAVLGLLLGLLLYETAGSNKPAVKVLNWIVALFVNVFRSIPFIILIVLLLPVTQVLVGAITGAKAAIPSLVISAAPFYARLVEIAFHEVDGGVIEAADAMGATKWQIVYKVLIPESLPALVSGLTVTAISLIGYTAMAGAIGAGGLGQLAYTDGFQSYNNAITLVATAVIVIIVFIFQYIGDFSVRKIDKR
ncbi:methionine ABC transporter permease [Ligilactobacillus apodemi]|nr:methionine ABC transporter permease [Ligilactobacillus apodemi]MCR1902104.1 ABC transporter permease [Ligilactobacillus apodemi]